MIHVDESSCYTREYTGLINCDDSVYFADRGINNSSLNIILKKSPYHYQVLNQNSQTESMRLGSLIHAMILGTPPLDDFKVWDGASFSSKAYDNWSDENPGKHVLAKELQKARAVVDRAFGFNDILTNMIDDADEMEIAVFRDVMGYRVKAKADALAFGDERATIWDIKTTQNLFDFVFSAKKYCYHMQRAWYVRHYAAALRKPVDFKLVVIEKNYPNAVVLYDFSDRVIEQGVDMVDQAFGIYTACMNSGVWSKPPSNIVLDWK